MRPYLSLTFVAILTAFLAGYFSLYLNGSFRPSESDRLKIKDLKERFQNHHKPLAVINLNKIYHSKEQLSLINPVFNPDVRKTENLLYSSDRDCHFSVSTLINSLKGGKPFIWEEFRCGARGTLPENFFKSPPYMHPSGSSYAFLAYAFNENAQVFEDSKIQENLPYFHLSELNFLKEKYLYGPFLFLKDLKNEPLKALTEGKTSIFSQQYYWARTFLFFAPTLEYEIFSNSAFKKFLDRYNFTIKKYHPMRNCFLKDGEVCWEYSLLHKLELTNMTTLAFFICSLLIIVLVVWLLMSKIKRQKIEDERKKLALQVLTHEFRTPVASLLLQVEEIKKTFSDLTPALQECFLRVSGDVYRLQRLTESSRNYLKLQNRKKLLDFKFVNIPSINEFVAQQIEHYKDFVEFRPLKKDISLVIDPYWVGIGLKNLLENALSHGRAPIEILIERTGRLLKISVVDSGTCQFDRINDMKLEFVKGEKSSGSGLGLNIVDKVIKEMGGELKFSVNPTKFTVVLLLKDWEEVSD